MKEIYGIEIIDNTAYTELINRTETAFGKQRNDFEGTLKDCIDYIKSKQVLEVIGILKKHID